MSALREEIISVAVGNRTGVHNLTIFALVIATPRTVEFGTFSEGRARGTTSITELTKGGSVRSFAS